MDIGDIVRHPLAAVSAGVGLISQGLGFLDPVLGLVGGLLAAVGSTAGTWFPLLGVLSTLGEGLAFIPAATVNNLFLVGAVVYALYLSDSLVEKLNDQFNRN
jgi:uncharacterized protein (DUF697 family)